MEHQKTITNDFDQIRKDTELLPMIFRAEAAVRKEAEKQQKRAEADAKHAREQMSALE